MGPPVPTTSATTPTVGSETQTFSRRGSDPVLRGDVPAVDDQEAQPPPGLSAGRARLPFPLILGFLVVAGIIAVVASRDRRKQP